MQDIRQIRLTTACPECSRKCCSQPYDWVYITDAEVSRLERQSGVRSSEFATRRRNPKTGHVFKTLNLPCQFLDVSSGRCSVYENRPLICKLFPFYPEPLTGNATLMPAQCGEHLEIHRSESADGWALIDYESEIQSWFDDIWREANVPSRS